MLNFFFLFLYLAEQIHKKENGLILWIITDCEKHATECSIFFAFAWVSFLRD